MLSVLCTVYNEVEFLEYSLKSYIDFVDNVVIVEGAYQETINLGKSPRSNDGTIEIIEKYRNNPKVHIIYANEQTDKDQRNIGLEKIKELNPDGWFLIVDGDEVWEQTTLSMVKSYSKLLDESQIYASYFKSLTFINDMYHFTEQEFPRLFKITSGAEFCNDNFVEWKDKGVKWGYPYINKHALIKFFHYSFCKGRDRFLVKKKWWESRFEDRKFEYGWKIDENGKITDDQHKVFPFKGHHPYVMHSHPMYNKKEE